MKYLKFFSYVIVYLAIIYLCLTILVHLAVYSSLKYESQINKVDQMQIKEGGKNWTSGTSSAAGVGIARTLFGKVTISFSLHCSKTVQSYLEKAIFFNRIITVFLSLIVSILLLLFLFIKKFKFQPLNIILIGIGVATLSYLILEIFLHFVVGDGTISFSLLRIFPPICY